MDTTTHAFLSRSATRRTRPASPGRRALLAVAVIGAIGAAIAAPSVALAAPLPGQPAPDFSLRDLEGRTVRLADLRGKTVVLEWHNPGCPFVQKHYRSGNLPGLQKRYARADTAWLVVNSTHAGHPDHLDAAALGEHLKATNAAPTAYLLDADGRAGRAYGARTTPQLFVIDPAGKVAYAGAIDSIRSASTEDIPKARNHVAAALDELRAGKPVSVATSTPYGCNVKYAPD